VRRTPLRPGRAELERRTELRRDTPAARAFADQRSRLPAKSERRLREDPERERLRQLVRERDGWRCQGADKMPDVACQGPLDVDAICPEGVMPGAHLTASNLHVLCRAHHDWKHAHAVEAAAVGLRRWSWQ
jgi:hypothetical protein